MHDCCQGLDALWLIHKRISSRIHVEQCAESIMLAKIQWCTAHQLYSFNCYVLSQSGFMSPCLLKSSRGIMTTEAVRQCCTLCACVSYT